jgi:S1-C subfamily serine protease
VTFTDGRSYAGTVMGSDVLTDIAVVKIEPRAGAYTRPLFSST